MASVSVGVVRGGLPWGWVIAGAITAIIVITVDKLLECQSINFSVPVLAFSVGFYLPLSTGVAMMAGATMSAISDNKNGESGVLFAGGLVTGEALAGIALAIPIVFFRDSSVLHIFGEGLWYVSVFLTIFVLYCLFNSTGMSSSHQRRGNSGGSNVMMTTLYNRDDDNDL